MENSAPFRGAFFMQLFARILQNKPVFLQKPPAN